MDVGDDRGFPDICQEVAIIDHGHVVGSGNMDDLRRGSRRRDISLEVDGAPPDWRPGVGSAQVVDHQNGGWRLSLDRDVDPEQLLADAKRRGRVIAFEYGPPSLAEVFLELVGR